MPPRAATLGVTPSARVVVPPTMWCVKTNLYLALLFFSVSRSQLYCVWPRDQFQASLVWLGLVVVFQKGSSTM